MLYHHAISNKTTDVLVFPQRKMHFRAMGGCKSYYNMTWKLENQQKDKLRAGMEQEVSRITRQ